MMALLIALRVALAGEGFREFGKILRREREMRRGRAPSAEERLEHRGIAFVLVGFIVFLGYLISMALEGQRAMQALLLIGAIALIVVGLGHYAASGLAQGRRNGKSS